MESLFHFFISIIGSINNVHIQWPLEQKASKAKPIVGFMNINEMHALTSGVTSFFINMNKYVCFNYVFKYWISACIIDL